jgi:hypothetical protein
MTRMPKLPGKISTPRENVERAVDYINENYNRNPIVTSCDVEVGAPEKNYGEPTTWWYGEKGPAALRKYALDLAMKMGGYEAQRCDDLIDDAIKIEAYLRGELADPNS